MSPRLFFIRIANFSRSHTISLEQMLPILMSRDRSIEKPHFPLIFKGGFGFSPRATGFILSIQGVVQLFTQLAAFPWLNKRLGALRTLLLTLATYPFLYLLAPYLAVLPENFRIPGIILLLVWKATAQSFSYPSLAIMLVNAAPSKRVLGLLNGAAASSASICRGFGPTVTGAIDMCGDNLGVSGLAWWACGGIAAVGLVPGSFMENQRQWNMEDDDDLSSSFL
jgi:hypothetical protein